MICIFEKRKKCSILKSFFFNINELRSSNQVFHILHSQFTFACLLLSILFPSFFLSWSHNFDSIASLHANLNCAAHYGPPTWKRIASPLWFPRKCHSFLANGGCGKERDSGGVRHSLDEGKTSKAREEGEKEEANQPFCLANRRDIRNTMRDIQAACSGIHCFPSSAFCPRREMQ